MIRSLVRFGVIGAIFGVVLAATLMSLDAIRPFPWYMNGTIERLTFKLCPLYVLGFASISKTSWIVSVFLGNAVLYGGAFALFRVASMGLRSAIRVK